MPFTETERLWKVIIFEPDMSISHLGSIFMSLRNPGIWVSNLTRDVYLPAYYVM